MRDGDEGPKVRIHPPSLLVAALVLGFAIRLFVGGALPLPRVVAEGFGGLLVIAGLALALSAVMQFAAAGEALPPKTAANRLLTNGPYRLSRNPIYLAMMLFGVGLGVATSNLWIVIATLAAGVILHFMAIKPEETYLEQRFGDAYAAYKKSVRRWI